ncbi:hypothetical protein Csa_001753 [Cucumis sativus]|uniref:Uncharacterized protein n=1 Tax=Cucumis sativus TaxID=3659 RepID=A0A0A0LH09_CUCSA|nr:hypothetical protein Csa_001753 [Cucumis sativus]
MALHESKLKLDYLEFSWQENDPFPTVEVVEKCIVGKDTSKVQNLDGLDKT